MRCLSILAPTVILWAGSAPCLNAGLYHPDWLQIEEIDENGYAQPLGADNFWNSYIRAREVGTKRPGFPSSPARLEVEDEVAKLRAKPQRNAEDDAKLSADLILLNNPNEALALLRPNQRTGGFLNAAHQARAYQSDLLDRAKYFEETAIEEDFPEKLFHLNKRQLTWYRRVERDYYFPWLDNRDTEQRLRPAGKGGLNNKETIDPLFPKPANPRVAAIRFVGESGTYKPGELAATERGKLPPDAIAIVQQMMLWNPWDFRLAWMLAELYVASGDYEMAEKLLDNCRQTGYSPTELSQHREAIQPLVEAIQADKLAKRKAQEEQLRADEQRKREKAHNERMNQIYVWTATGLVLAVLAYWQTREIIRRLLTRKSTAPQG